MSEGAGAADPFEPRVSAFALWARRLGCSEGQLYTMVIGVLLTFMVSANALPSVAWDGADAPPVATASAAPVDTPGAAPATALPPAAAFDPAGGVVADGSTAFGAGESPPFLVPSDWAPGEEAPGGEGPSDEPPSCPAAAVFDAARMLPPAASTLPLAEVVARLAEATGCSAEGTSVSLVAVAFDAGRAAPLLPGSKALLSTAAGAAACALADTVLAVLAMAQVAPFFALPPRCSVLSPASADVLRSEISG